MARGSGGDLQARCVARRHFDVEPGATGVARVLCKGCRRQIGGRYVILHRIDLATGQVIETKFYRDIAELQESSAGSATSTGATA